MKNLSVDNTILTKDKKFTYLSSDASATDTTLTVQSITGFTTDQILCIGEIGREKSELVQTHATTSPSGSTITLTAAITFDHPQDTKVYLVDWDQVEFSHASTTTGDKSVLSTEDIQADDTETRYKDTAQSSGYYFTRFKDSVNTTYSSYSDPVPYAGYGDNTVFSIKQRALESVGESIGDLISHDFLNKTLWEGRRELHNSLKRWSFRKEFNYNLGNVSTGDYRIAVPTDLQDPNTNKNVFNVKIGVEHNLEYIPKKEWDEYYRGVPHTTLSSAYTVTDAAVTLTDSADFDEDGTITIEGDDIEYSANDESTGELTVSTDGDSNHDSGKDVWQNVGDGLPTAYTIFDGYIYFNRPVSSDYDAQNVWMDYYQELTAYDSDADELDEPEYDMFVNYLAYNIKKRKNNGVSSLEDDDYQQWVLKKTMLINKEVSGQEIKLIPDID